MQEFLRVASLPTRDLMDEYFDSEIVKAVLTWDGLIGSKMAPRSPNSAVLKDRKFYCVIEARRMENDR